MYFTSSAGGATVNIIDDGPVDTVFGAATQMTWCFWANFRNMLAGSGAITRQNAASNGFKIGVNTGGRFSVSFGAGGAQNIGEFVYATSSAWDHFAVVFTGTGTGNAGRLNVFLNASSQGLSFTNTIPASLTSVTSTSVSLVFGGSTTPTMDLQHVFIYNRILTQSEIAQQMNMRLPLESSSLKFWLPMDEGSTTPTDLTGLGATAGDSIYPITVSQMSTTRSSPPVSYGLPVPTV